MERYDVIVLGGGAAGLMCAITAGERGRRVLVLERSSRIGRKILMSGGGRCNFTNLHASADHFLSANPRFCISALSRFTQWDFVELVERHRIPYHEKQLGQLFCDRSSKDVVGMLGMECARAGVRIRTRCDVTSVRRDARYTVICNGEPIGAESLVVATGGLSIPRMGATDFGHRLARELGLEIRPTRAGLVPFTFSGPTQALMARLAGVSTRARLETGGTSFTEDMLFTHRGLSGPGALQLSSYWADGEPISLDLLPDRDAASHLLEEKGSRPRATLRSVLGDMLPRALVLELESSLWPELAGRRLADIPGGALGRVASQLHGWSLSPSGTEGYRTAEVTLGGIDTGELSSKTMESRRHPGLYCIGEVVDVTGHLGGFNFQWAWSGHAAGLAA